MSVLFAAATLILSLAGIYILDTLAGVTFDPTKTMTFLILYWVLIDYYDRREHDRKASRRS